MKIPASFRRAAGVLTAFAMIASLLPAGAFPAAAKEEAFTILPDFSYFGAVGTLSASETQAVSAAVYTALALHEDKIDLAAAGLDLTTENAPDYFRITREIMGGYTVGILADATQFSYSVGGDYITVRYLYDDPDVYEAAYQTAVTGIGKILSGVSMDWSEAERALYLHDYLAVHYDYDYESAFTASEAAEPYSAYGLLTRRTAVCDGYSRLYEILLHEAGVNSVHISSYQLNHAWNAVEIGGVWYLVDVTHDDRYHTLAGQVSHEYFLCTAETYAKAHAATDWTSVLGDMDQMAIPDTFADAFWHESHTAFKRYQNQWLTTTGDASGAALTLYAYDPVTNTAQSQALLEFSRNDARWRVIGSAGSYWLDTYIVPEILNDTLYFITSNSLCVYRNGETIYYLNRPASGMEFLGLYCEDGTLYLGSGDTPNTLQYDPDSGEPVFDPVVYTAQGSWNSTIDTRLGKETNSEDSHPINYWKQDLSIDGWVYGAAPSVPAAQPAYGEAVYLYASSVDGDFTDEMPTHAGQYYAVAVVAADEAAHITALTSRVVPFEISRAEISVKAADAQISYLQSVLSYPFEITGDVPEADLAAIGEALEIGADYTAGDPVGTYPVTVSIDEAAFPDFRFTMQDAVLTVSPLVPALRIKDQKYVVSYTGEPFTLPEGCISSDIDVPAEQWDYRWEQEAADGFVPMEAAPVEAGSYRLTVSVGDDANYTRSAQDILVQIVPAKLTISCADLSVTYGSSLPETADVVYDGLKERDAAKFTPQLPIVYAEDFAGGAGSYPLTLEIPEDANYEITVTAPTLTVTRKKLTVTPTPLTLHYGDALPDTLPVSCLGLLKADVGQLSAIKVTTPYAPGKDAGSYELIAQVPDLPNYDVSCEVGTLTVDALPVTFTWQEERSFVYDGEPHAVRPEPVGLLEGDTLGITLENCEAVGAGTYTAQITQIANPNYRLDPDDANLSAAWEITRAALTVTPADQEITYGDALPEAAFLYEGFCGEDDESVLRGQPTLASEYHAGSSVGTYKLTMDGEFAADNYTITAGTGTLTVLPKELTILWGGDLNAMFDGLEKTVTAALQGALDGDDVSLTLTGNTASKAGDYTAAASLTGKSAGNYVISGDTTRAWTLAGAEMRLDAAPLPLRLTYTGKPQALVSAGDVTGGKLSYSLDGETFTADIPTAVDAGDYTVSYLAQAIPNFVGSFRGKIHVTVAPLDAAEMELHVEIPPCVYRGEPLTPPVTVRNGETLLTEGTDYTFIYENNSGAGEGIVRLTFLGNYTGTAKQTFPIEAETTTTTTTTTTTKPTTSTTTTTTTTTKPTTSTTTTTTTTTTKPTTSTTTTTTTKPTTSTTTTTTTKPTTSTTTTTTTKPTTSTTTTTTTTTKSTTSTTTTTKSTTSTTTTTTTTKPTTSTTTTTTTKPTTSTTTTTTKPTTSTTTTTTKPTTSTTTTTTKPTTSTTTTTTTTTTKPTTSTTTTTTTKPTTSTTTTTTTKPTTSTTTTTTTKPTTSTTTTTTTKPTTSTTTTTTTKPATSTTTTTTTKPTTSTTTTTTTTTTKPTTSTTTTTTTTTTVESTTGTETTTAPAPIVTDYEFRTEDLMRMCFAEDDTPFTVADLIAALRQRALYDDGSAGEWQDAAEPDISLRVRSAQELFAEAEDAVFTGGVPADVRYQLPDGSQRSQTLTIGSLTVCRRGDFHTDGTVNASDAADLLVYAAAIGGGREVAVSDVSAFAGDVNRDGAVNAEDAADILIYAAIAGSSGSADWADVLTP